MSQFNESVNLQQTACSVEDVSRLSAKLEPLLHGESRGLILMTVLSIAFMIQDDTLSITELVDGVRSTSQHIALYLSGIHSGLNAVGPDKLN